MRLRAGFSAVDITPHEPAPLNGFANRIQPSMGIHDPLFCRGLALERDGQRLLLLVLDALELTAGQDQAARRHVGERIGLDADAIMIHATHTHSAPATWPMGSSFAASDSYAAWLPERLAHAAEAAVRALEEVALSLGVSRAEGVAYNRRQLLKDGSMPLQHVEDRSQVVRTGPLDERLQVLALEKKKGELAGAIVHFSCHPVVLSGDNRLITADYPGALIRHLSQKTGLDPSRILFVNGACGDVNPIRPGAPWDNLERTGALLAEAAMAALSVRTALRGRTLKGSSTRIEMGFRVPSDESLRAQIERAKSDIARTAEEAPRRAAALGLPVEAAQAHLGKIPRSILDWAENVQRLKASGREPSLAVDVSVFRVGALKWLAGPFEIFTQIALEGKAAAGDPAWVLPFTNGCHGYLPDDRAHDEPIGYEMTNSHVWYRNPGPFARGSGGKLVEAWKRLSGKRRTP
ncbi:MAG: neutral/alkaline non-lysosomal ceramidase N-terminal domain-containing protein [Candidatus Sumerlaeota bacterium]|nr:neutral/alkaline non-lysosomal ceramidase N-terminal domain-containing protein [Candidatus Sumerlaeota bacterium]